MPSSLRLVVALLLYALPAVARADNPIVRITTDFGFFDVELCDAVSSICLAATPIAVANFLDYVDRGDYDGTIFHRNIATPNFLNDFVIQGGAFYFDGNIIKARVPQPAIVNEFAPVNSNRRGTLAMAKFGGDPDSATNQWFINLNDNGEPPPNGLDYQNGGFTVFGVVLGDGMDVVDVMTTTPSYNFTSQLIIDAVRPYIDPDTLISNFAAIPLQKNPPLTLTDLSALQDLAVEMAVTRVPEAAAPGGIALAALFALARRRAS